MRANSVASPRSQPMKITQVKVRLFEMPMPRPFHPTWQFLPTTSARIHIVEVHTDEGIVGIGSGGGAGRREGGGLFLAGPAPGRPASRYPGGWAAAPTG